jgi:hypothetical protein|nr:MAG TPA: hypothetical protein [Caudoviricetes sp.]
MITVKLANDVKEVFAKCGSDLEATYEQFKDQLTPKDVYDICINKITLSDELPKEDLVGNRLNPFLYHKDEETGEKELVEVKSNYKALKVGTLSPIEPKSMEIEIGEPKRHIIPSPDTNTLNYESIGFAIGFKKATAKEVLELANGNTARLIPALQWLYKQTSEEGLRKRIQEITLEVLFN